MERSTQKLGGQSADSRPWTILIKLFVVFALHCPLISFALYLYHNYPSSEGIIGLCWYEQLLLLVLLVMPYLSLKRLGLLPDTVGEMDHWADEENGSGKG